MAQNTREAKAKEWIHNVLMPALQQWASTREAVIVDIEPTATDPNPLGKTLKVKDVWPHPVDVSGDGLIRQRSQKPVDLSYTVRLEVLTENVIGHIEFVVDGEVKHRAPEDNILSWDKERIRQDIMNKMCG